MSERSEFGRRAASGEERRGPMRLHRIGECPAKGLFGSFLVLQKGTRTRSGRSSALASFARVASPCLTAKNRASALFARLTFVLSKVSKTAIAGRDPPHEAAAGPCASRSAGHAAQTRCAQTWAALRPRCPAMLGSLYGSKDQKPIATATAKARATAKAKARAKYQCLRRTPQHIRSEAWPPPSARTAAIPRAHPVPHGRRPPAPPDPHLPGTTGPNARGCSRACGWR